MHPVLFSAKRVHWLSVKLYEWVLSLQDAFITAARFDLLRVVHAHPEGMARWKLVELLGVSGPGVSRMLKALEAERLLVRSRDDDDRRLVMVKLTEEGQVFVDCTLLGIEDAEDYVCRVLSPRDQSGPSLVETMEVVLLRARICLRDWTPFPHPYRCDNIVTWFGDRVVLEWPPDVPAAPVVATA